MQYLLASTYGSGTYTSATYSNPAAVSTGTTSPAPSGGTTTTSGGTLSNTGFDVLLIASLACVIALTAMIVRIWKRPAPATVRS